MTEIQKHGVYRLSHQAYHADPAPEPSLSSTIVRTLLSATPAHAREKHPRTATRFEPEHKTAFDLGTATHAILLRDREHFAIWEDDDWRKRKDADGPAFRAAAWEDGKTPLLRQQYEDACARASRCLDLLHDHDASDAFRSDLGHTELTLIWREENGVWCRCKPDWLPRARKEGLIIYDYKSSSVMTAPEAWASRTAWDLGCDVQAAWYRRGVRKVFGLNEVRFRFVAQEIPKPWLLNVYEVDSDIMDAADAECERAIKTWGRCLETGRWPGYETKIYWMERPIWHERKAEIRRFRQIGSEDAMRAAIDAQAPMEDA